MIKCDETKPKCVNCHKYDQICQYPKVKSKSPSDQSPSQAVSTPSSVGNADVAPSQQNNGNVSLHQENLNINHLRLIHHFTTVTARTLASEPEAEEVYQTYVVKLGFKFPFLLHSILAVAAIHLGRLYYTLRDEYLVQAQSHYDAALSQFRSEITDIDESNMEAVLGFIGLGYPYSCALPVDTQSIPEQILDSMLQTFALTRRVRPMVSTEAMFVFPVGADADTS